MPVDRGVGKRFDNKNSAESLFQGRSPADAWENVGRYHPGSRQFSAGKTSVTLETSMTTLFAATGNAHKLSEIRSLLPPDTLVVEPRDLGVSLHIEENGDSFAANAQLKSLGWARLISESYLSKGINWTLGDDSGLEVDGLDGKPGIHSARFAALDDGRPGNSSDPENNAKLLRLLRENPAASRKGRFRCVLALTPIIQGATVETLQLKTRFFAGACPGTIAAQPSGIAGFGYDPLFIPDGYNHSFAELGEAVKNRLSHRSVALSQLNEFLRQAVRE
jgi:XTP/dITP diphosphohydrolase